MKNILVIDVINQSRSIVQMNNIRGVVGVELEGVDFQEVHLITEELNEQQLKSSDAVIFSGSMHSVYEDFDWKKKMHRAFEIIIERNIPALASCFGAQFLGYHLGSRVIKNPRGLEFGPIKLTLTTDGQAHPLIGDYHQEKFVFATHQDIVETLPVGATLLAFNDNTPVQAFQYGPILATQFHSDLPTARSCELLASRREKYTECGFLRDDQHYEELMSQLYLGEQGHDILHRFLGKV